VNSGREHFQKALKLNATGKVDDALKEFQAAYDVSPNWRILYNIGQTSRTVRDYPRSLRAFERYLSEGGTSVPAARRAEVEKEVASLNGLVARVDVAAPDGSTIRVDGQVVGKAPLPEPAVVNPGKRKVEVEHDGQTDTKEVDVRAGSTQRVELGKSTPPTASASATPKPTAAPPPTATSPEQPPKVRDNSTWIAVGAVTTGALAIGAGVTGTLAIVFANQLKDTTYAGPDHRPPDGTHASSLSKRIETLAVVTDALVAGAVVAGGLTVYFIATNSPARKERAGAWRAAVGLRPGGLVVNGSF